LSGSFVGCERPSALVTAGGRTDAISRPGLPPHLANRRQAWRTEGPMRGQGEVEVHIPGYGAPRNEQ
jgi:hypothetical protein